MRRMIKSSQVRERSLKVDRSVTAQTPYTDSTGAAVAWTAGIRSSLVTP